MGQIAAKAKVSHHKAAQALAVAKAAPELAKQVRDGRVKLHDAAKQVEERNPRKPAPPPKPKQAAKPAEPELDEYDFVVDQEIGKITGMVHIRQMRCPDEKREDFHFGLVRSMLGLLRGLLEMDRKQRERLTQIICEVLSDKDRAALRGLKW